MGIKLRQYTAQPGFTDDFIKVRDFLKRIYKQGYKDENWLWARWEYMFSHPILDETKLSQIGIWEDDGKIVALASYELFFGSVYFSFDRDYSFLKKEMLEYAVQHISAEDESRVKKLNLFINDNDAEFAEIAKNHGYERTEDIEYMSEFRVSGAFPDIKLPEGFSIVSLAEENDLAKINRVLWRGFNHLGEAPSEFVEDRKKMQSGPDFKKELTIAVKAPNGDFVSFCGMWYDEGTEYAYVEPVATDPDYRRLGLGRAAVLEGIKRCMGMGADVAYVGSGKQFYYSIGFKPLFTSRWWKKP